MSYKADWHDDLDLAQFHYAGDSKNRLLLLRQPSLSVESFNPVNKDEGNIDYGYDDCDLMVAFAIQAGWTAEAYRDCKNQWLVLRPRKKRERFSLGYPMMNPLPVPHPAEVAVVIHTRIEGEKPPRTGAVPPTRATVEYLVKMLK